MRVRLKMATTLLVTTSTWMIVGGGTPASASLGPKVLGGGGSCAATLAPGQDLHANYELCSSSGGYTMVMQTDGNLVEYNSSGSAIWATDTAGTGSNDFLAMQSDGNMVVYSASGSPLWQSGTYGIGEGTIYLALQGDSNVVLYDSSGAVWATQSFAPQTYAQEIMFQFGWNSAQWPSLNDLWTDESNWMWDVCSGGATYPSPSCDYENVAYGIPQALPGSKMASAGPDWVTAYWTQIRWGMQYIKTVYVNPTTAYNDWLSRSPHWYSISRL